MQTSFKQGLGGIVLSASLIAGTVLFGLRAIYSPAVQATLAAMMLVATCLSAWWLGASAITTASDERRRLAIAASLLITPIALFALLAGMGPPGEGQTAAEEEFRFLVLLVSAIVIAAGWIVLKEALSEAGERLLSPLGFAAAVLAAPLYIVFTGVQAVDCLQMQRAGSIKQPPGFPPLDELSVVLLFFGGVLSYLATAAFAASLARMRWLSRPATGVFVALSLLAVMFLLKRGLSYPDLSKGFAHWYTIPSFVVGIPAVPWMMPCALGIALLRRAGRPSEG